MILLRFLFVMLPILFFALIGLGSYFFFHKKQRLRDCQHEHPKIFSILLYLYILITSIIFVFWVDLSIKFIWCIFCGSINPDVLSALITAQSAVLVLAITLSLIIVQHNSNVYSSRMIELTKSFFDLTVVIIIFVVSITFDAFLILYQNILLFKFQWLIVLALGLCLGTMLSLVPYRRNILIFFRPENFIVFMKRDIADNINDIWLRRNHVIGIFDIIISSLERKDLETAECGLNAIEEIIGIGKNPDMYFSSDNINVILSDERIKEVFKRSISVIWRISCREGFTDIFGQTREIERRFKLEIKKRQESP
jgi:hypothetical protein